MPSKKRKAAASAPASAVETVTVHIESNGGQLGEAVEYGARHFSAAIKVGGQLAGQLACKLVKRERGFHAACDAISQDLQAIGFLLFEGDGKPRLQALKGDASVGSGGFLYIESFSTPQHRAGGATDVGAGAIVALLNHPLVQGHWSVAAYVADASEAMTEEEKRGLQEQQMAMMFGDVPRPSPAEEQQRKERIRRGIATDARQFVRAGFREVQNIQKEGWMYITAGMPRGIIMTHEEALAAPLSAATPVAPTARTAEDGELLELFVRTLGRLPKPVTAASAASLLAQADGLIARGANWTRANVLQACVANGATVLYPLLVQRGAEINGQDEKSGMTALMIAAEVAPGRVRPADQNPHDPAHRADIETLIALGADKRLTNKQGQRAYAIYGAMVRNYRDMMKSFGGRAAPADPALQALLRP